MWEQSERMEKVPPYLFAEIDRILTMVKTSSSLGTLWIILLPFAKIDAAIIGKTAFLAPETSILPESFFPP